MTALPFAVAPLRLRLVRWGLLCLATATGSAGVWLYAAAVAADGWNPFEVVATALVALLAGWIGFGFWTATLGFALSFRRRRGPSQEATDSGVPLSRTAVLMPVYNESPADVFAGLFATMQSVAETGQADRFEFYVLSDSTDSEAWLKEEEAWAALVARLPEGLSPVYYRHRPENTSRKTGNLCDYLTKWGSRSEFMIVFDADSTMDGRTLVEMVRRMDADPAVGILQVPPLPVGNRSLFARWQQFSARLYSQVFLGGYASWTATEGNYWGHNAIIRIAPFMQHCCLPVLSGRPPLGGEILSHDFVEAALLAGAGYKVVLAEDLSGSYEECPTRLIDFAIRDHRWCQGNLQHLRLVFAEGLRPVSRWHLAMGAIGYLASPLWLLFLASTLGGWLWDRFASGPEAAAASATALPAPAIALFVLSLAMLLLPKVYSAVHVIRQPTLRKQFGGGAAVAASVVVETLLSALLAPILMLFHSKFVAAIFAGVSIRWSAQNRSEGATTFRQAVGNYWAITAGAAALTAAVARFAPELLGWFLPLTAGPLLAVPLAMLVSRPGVGGVFAEAKLFLTPEELDPPEVLRTAAECRPVFAAVLESIDRSEGEAGGTHFRRVLENPTVLFRHRRILEATGSQTPLPPERRAAAVELVEQGGPDSIAPADRRAVLLDGELLRELHVRSRLRSFEQAAPSKL